MKKVSDKLDWLDINHETLRVYEFPNGHRVTIVNPMLLNVSASGGHRILDAKDVAHYIPSGWVHIYWKTCDDVAFRF